MGFIKAFSGAISETFANQWKDYYVPRADISATAGVFQAVPNSQGGENYKGNENIITNGSKIVVPEGTGLITVQDGAITGFIAEPGGFEFRSDDPNSQSIFAGDGIVSPLIKASWEKVKFGGVPGAQQLAFYVNLKEIPNNTFGTQYKVRFFDSYLGAQVSVIARGKYTLKIVDPLLFAKNILPATYLQPGAPIFDFADLDNKIVMDLHGDVVGCLQPALSKYCSSEDKEASIVNIQADSSGFAKVLSATIDEECDWKGTKGLEIGRVSIVGLDYDEATDKLIDRIAEERSLGKAYSDNLAGMKAAAAGQALKTAAGNENGAMMGFMGMNMAQMNANNMTNSTDGATAAPANGGVVGAATAPESESTTKLLEAKKLLDAGAITQEDYDKLKAQILGI